MLGHFRYKTASLVELDDKILSCSPKNYLLPVGETHMHAHSHRLEAPLCSLALVWLLTRLIGLYCLSVLCEVDFYCGSSLVIG